MLIKILLYLLLTHLLILSLHAQEHIDHDVIARIKEEGFQNSQVMETISYLTDIYGPRVVGSPEYREAADWAKTTMLEWGLDNVRLESMDKGQRGWRIESFSIEMIEPRYMPIIGYPKAWCKSTNGEIVGEPIIVTNIYKLDSLEKYQEKLKDKIVLIDKGRKIKPSFEPFSVRFNDDVLAESEKTMVPFPSKTLYDWEAKTPLRERMPSWNINDEKKQKVHQLLVEAEPAVLIEPSRKTHGIVQVEDAYFGNDQTIEPVPAFVIANEHFSRLIRMIKKDVMPTLKIHLKTTYFRNPEYNVNILGEIKGTDKKLRSEIVLLGAHFDSWHAGTGATDNGASAAILMEVMRIIKTLKLKPRRTIQIGLWGGEEVGFHGSRAYVIKYIGDLKTGEYKSEPAKITAYLNLDNGIGKIRGIYLQGNEKARPIFAELLAPFEYLGAKTLTIQSTTHTDHEVFDAMNIPSFQFIQDLINYQAVTHHSNMDLYDYVIEEDVKQNVVIIAALAYHLAIRDKAIPRKQY